MEVYRPWNLEPREMRLEKSLHLTLRQRGAGLGLNRRMHGLAILLIRDAKHSAVGDTRHAMQHGFDFCGINIDAARNDHVLGAVAQVQKPVGVEVAYVAGRDEAGLFRGDPLGVVAVVGEIGNVREFGDNFSDFASGQSVPANECPVAPAPISPSRAAGGVPILAVGRLGAGITKDFANQSELARDLMLGAAQHSIRIVQQDLGFSFGRADTLFPDSTIDRLVDFLRRRDGHIYIVLSNLGAAGNSGSTYSNGVTLEALARHLRDAVQRRVEAKDPLSRYEIRRGPDPVNALLCERVHLAPFRFGPDATWPSGKTISNHSKLWMVDDRVFYIGSDNMYPVNLQEFGYIVDDKKAAADILDAYWKPLWQWSQRAVVSGEGVEKCIFREVKQ